ncbi:MAG: hypothetical protein AAGF25_00530 [Pseudomonadota bacterium]
MQLSQHINRKTTQNIYRAFDFAKASGLPMNTYVVINLVDRTDKSSNTVFRGIMARYRRWLRYKYRQSPNPALLPIWTYSHENPNNANPHVNLVLHVPANLFEEFERKLRNWVFKEQGTGSFDVSVQRITPGTDKNVANYINKGVDPDYAEHFFLDAIASPQGDIFGRRAGVSRAINKEKRDRVNYNCRTRNIPSV